MNTFAKDYIEVHERMAEFYAKHPDGSLQGSWEWTADGTLIVYRAEAYRTPDDPRPGVGYAQEVYPGKTPYTKGSELMNAGDFRVGPGVGSSRDCHETRHRVGT